MYSSIVSPAGRLATTPEYVSGAPALQPVLACPAAGTGKA